jgi:Aspartyl protease
MRHARCTLRLLIGSLIISTGCLFGGVPLQVRDGRPIVDGVYVNGFGPYRFLLDTGSNVNLVESRIAGKTGMNAAFPVELASAGGKVRASESDGNEVTLGLVTAKEQIFVLSELDAIHHSFPDVQGVLGEVFLGRFDYMLDLRGKRLETEGQDRPGTHVAYKLINARPVVSTSLGDLALDSGVARLTLFGVLPGISGGNTGEFRTLAGTQRAGTVTDKPLLIDGRRIWSGDAVAISNHSEQGVDGLLPLGLFKTVYFCNSEGYVIFD